MRVHSRWELGEFQGRDPPVIKMQRQQRESPHSINHATHRYWRARAMLDSITEQHASDAQQEAADAAVLAAQSVDEHASFGIEEGEVDQLERKWITWCA